MQSLRDLLKPAEKGKGIYWDENLTTLFEESKLVIIEAIKSGIKTFMKGDWTCFMPDFCKTGIGYLLMQKKCMCTKISPYCCTGGWQTVLAIPIHRNNNLLSGMISQIITPMNLGSVI